MQFLAKGYALNIGLLLLYKPVIEKYGKFDNKCINNYQACKELNVCRDFPRPDLQQNNWLPVDCDVKRV